MTKRSNILLFLCIAILTSCNPKIPNNLIYIDQSQPFNQPQVFAPNFISKDTIAEFGSVFNKKGDEFFFAIDNKGHAKINYTTIKDGQWLEPITIVAHPTYSYNDPFLSPDETRLYYISNMPRNETDTIADFDIWYAEKDEYDWGYSWSEPINAGHEINTDANEFYISFSNDGAMYFATNKENYEDRKHDFNIFKSVFENGKFQTPIKVSDAINSKRYEADVFVAPDESYLIFCSARRSGFGRGDLYISFKDESGNWTDAINMGETINSEGHEICPFVTHDGKYFFYTSNQDIYWVSTGVFDVIKNRVKK